MRRVEVEMRKAYFVVVGTKRKRFATEAAAYYKLCAAMLGEKYLAALREVASYADDLRMPTPGHAPEKPSPAVLARHERAVEMFFNDDHTDGPEYFSTDRWQAYVRRVARKMRALDRMRKP